MSREGTSDAGDLQMVKARKELAQRRRRLILDDDGDVVYYRGAEEGPESFCKIRLADCLGTAVDSFVWCVMWGLGITGSNTVRYWQNQKLGMPFQDNMPDPTPVVGNFCKEHGLEVFGSIRMNDCHDAFGIPHGKLVYPLKVEHPEFLIGDQSQKGRVDSGLAAAMWSGLDYAHPEVREDRLWWIEHTAADYDLDGVDLNFFRMPWIFKIGEEAKNMHLMTDIIRRARSRLDQIGRKRGRPVLLGVRVPGTVETCLRIGLDVETWLKEGLIDRLLTGGGYVPFSTPAEELIGLGHSYDVPVYPCINVGAIGIGAWAEALRGAASNLWYAGADGLFLWNFQYLSTPVVSAGRPSSGQYRYLAEIGEPDNLRYLNKIFAVDSTQRMFEQYARASAPYPLPLKLDARAQETYKLPLRIGDDIQAAAKKGPLALALGLKLNKEVPASPLHLVFSGEAIGNGSIRGQDPQWVD